MTSGLVNASFSLPEWQAVKMISFAPCELIKQVINSLDQMVSCLLKHLTKNKYTKEHLTF